MSFSMRKEESFESPWQSDLERLDGLGDLRIRGRAQRLANQSVRMEPCVSICGESRFCGDKLQFEA